MEDSFPFSERVRRDGEAVLPVRTAETSYDNNLRKKRRFLLPDVEKGDHGHGKKQAG
jgi:hypothetical protein